MDIFRTGVPSRFGQVQLTWAVTTSGPRVIWILLPGDTRTSCVFRPQAPLVLSPDDAGIRNLAKGIGRFLAGNDVHFDLSLLDLDRCTPFQKSVLLAEYAIPRGYVSTYGKISRHLGLLRGARAVGAALATNPFPVVIPCHRAVRSDGSLGGFQGGLEMKAELLRMEGIRLLDGRRVMLEKVYY